MNVPTLEVDKTVAAERYTEYLTATDQLPKDDQCKRVYKQLARGNRVLNLCEAMRLAGTDHLYRPRLAIARASNLQTTVDFRWRGQKPIFGDRSSARSQYRNPQEGVFQGRVVLPEWTFPRDQWGILGKTAEDGNIREIHAAIPTIPPKLRPKHPRRYHILWEVDNWVAGPGSPEHSRDPLLLKHLASWFFVIVAEWNLRWSDRCSG